MALCVQAEVLRSAQPMSARPGIWVPQYDQAATKEFIYRCLQLFYAVLPRQGRRGQRHVSSDPNIHQAMAWFEVAADGGFSALQCATSSRLKTLQVSLATSQRNLWMLYRLCDLRCMAKPVGTQCMLESLLNGQLRPIVLERRLTLDTSQSLKAQVSPGGGKSCRDSGRILGDLDSTTGSNDDASSDASSVRSGSVRRMLASGTASVASEDGQRALGDLDAQSSAHSEDSSCDGDTYSDVDSFAEDGMQRIMAASECSDGASSDSASSAGFNSFGAGYSSMWSGVSRSVTSSTSSLANDMLMQRRPMLEGYAHALRPLFMTRGDLMHLLAKFPAQVLMGTPASGSRSFAAHRELLEELFASFLVAVKSPERRGKIKLAFGSSFVYEKTVYSLGPLQTCLCVVAHGVRRSGHEPFPVLYEEEHEDDEGRSEAAVSMAPQDVQMDANSVLEFEEVVVPLTEVSSRELFLAELMQSDQCQLLASLSQGSHSKYGHRSLRRRRRTLRHVREAAALLANVPAAQ